MIFAVLDLRVAEVVLKRHFKLISFFTIILRNGVFNLLLGELYPRENEVIPKSENAVVDDRVLKFLYDVDLRHVESSARCHRKYKNGRIKVDLG